MNECEMKEYKIPKKNISQRNLLITYTPPNSPTHLYNNVINTSDDNNNNITDNTTENIPENNNLQNKLSKIYQNRKKNNFVRVPLHLLLHIILLSIFEIIALYLIHCGFCKSLVWDSIVNP